MNDNIKVITPLKPSPYFTYFYIEMDRLVFAEFWSYFFNPADSLSMWIKIVEIPKSCSITNL